MNNIFQEFQILNIERIKKEHVDFELFNNLLNTINYAEGKSILIKGYSYADQAIFVISAILKYFFKELKNEEIMQKLAIARTLGMKDIIYLKATNNLISVDSIRQLQTQMYQLPFEYDKKFIIINSFQQMNYNSIVSLLKITEDIPKSTFIFILSDFSTEVPQTILSRFHKYYLHKSSLESFQLNLKIEDPKVAHFYYDLSNSSFELAKELININLYQIYKEILLIKEKNEENMIYQLYKLSNINKIENKYIVNILSYIISNDNLENINKIYNLIKKLENNLKNIKNTFINPRFINL